MRILILLFFLFGEASAAQKTICLNMIVKNEAEVIRRCLDSVKPLIDYWVIVDTGSSDKTKEIIQEHMKGIPGELHERRWVNFGHNRNEALELARSKGDYILFMDADDILRTAPDFKLPDLTLDFYCIYTHSHGMECLLPRLISASKPWKWYGVLHEFINSAYDTKGEVLKGIEYVYISDGFRAHDPLRYEKDIRVLKEGIKNEPQNDRYPFYLAITYQKNKDLINALKYFEIKIKMGGSSEEVFYSKFMIARVQEELGREIATIRKSYQDAHYDRPTRIEPLYYQAQLEKRTGNLQAAFELLRKALLLSRCDIAYVETWIYDYGALIEYAELAYQLEKYPECALACKLLSQDQKLPEPVQAQLKTLSESLIRTIKHQIKAAA